jgi:hypothetical protein
MGMILFKRISFEEAKQAIVFKHVPGFYEKMIQDEFLLDLNKIVFVKIYGHEVDFDIIPWLREHISFYWPFGLNIYLLRNEDDYCLFKLRFEEVD